ncbi:hypothetical protein A3B52_01905 [Candidatus Curtissbacteria bacterium RIFCSPLOWO2_01_FULL_41_28]|uniref:Ketose-bisphosphate aldolase n=1 Tax=Candidatus Curtissbacteria bacterium RIFOXYA1_FULL_41_14 TaxID=1797737 RepID=A0A1F5HB18_9BACT|nr:MAG: Ketose-bisphosphate aldolase, class-II [Candidatus Curtissbacteria bacterium GW2011_GWB1_40_28]KKR61396.1 MAG: Ketose-bisphosphate aldolase, class-II [Microgenomates group bacterium GW2011_GWC1_40_35]KKS02100.1 MAG: Ketose-bisphosphate aldolase, class-II [Candidatus Curtissbacteria bacterium GW2011_GWC2_41_21]OGD81303.1 MAG: hypothetical protein A2683_01045 [Candidatus Curtissbacteria bacterium RIFCSPHIGHO2_01_FULL_34_40]OGD91678.1 MAG: hypothetical protein A3E14_02460 [Candidatus Curti
MTARDWFLKAQTGGWAIGAFNADNLEILKAICLAAKNKKSPVMVEFSPGEVDYFGLRNIVDLVKNAREEYRIPILLNLDHGRKVEDCLAAVNMGSSTSSGSSSFDLIHFDGSDSELEENIHNTKKVVEAAHTKGLLVEGEIDKIPGASEIHDQDLDSELVKKSYTDPQKAAKFVSETGIDIFAAFFGNVHGTFPNQPDLDFDLLARIRKSLPDTFLSLHGGSGIPADQVKQAIEVGKIVKVNVNTELRQAFRDALTEKLGEKPNEYAMYKVMPDVILSVAAVVESKIDIFGSAGRV